MSKDKAEDKAKKNIKALRDLRVQGKHVAAGEVVAKSAFPNKADWQNVCNMTPPRAEETADAVTAEAKTALGQAAAKAEAPAAKGKGKKDAGNTGGMPGT